MTAIYYVRASAIAEIMGPIYGAISSPCFWQTRLNFLLWQLPGLPPAFRLFSASSLAPDSASWLCLNLNKSRGKTRPYFPSASSGQLLHSSISTTGGTELRAELPFGNTSRASLPRFLRIRTKSASHSTIMTV